MFQLLLSLEFSLSEDEANEEVGYSPGTSNLVVNDFFNIYALSFSDLVLLSSTATELFYCSGNITPPIL